MKKNGWMFFLQGFLLFNLLWFLASISVHSLALPSPLEVYANFPKVFEAGIAMHFMVSFKRLMAGIIISLVIGTILGLIMGESQKADKILNPLVYFTYPIPKLALLPVIMILFGLGDGSKVTLIVLITIFPVIVAVKDGVKNIDKELYNILQSLGANKVQKLTQITLPAITAEILTSVKISIGTALSVLFFAENYGTKFGLGYYIQDSWMRMDYISMFGGICILATLGFVLFAALDKTAAHFNRSN